MSDMLPYTDIAFDLHTHAVYLSKHSRAPSSYPSYRPNATAAPAFVDVSVQPCTSAPLPFLSTDETVSEFLESAKNVLADSLESFFPTPHTNSNRICHSNTLCPFWVAARTSIRALRHTPYKSPLMNGPDHFSKNTIFKDMGDDDVNLDKDIQKNIPQDVTSTSTWNILHLAVRTGRVDVFRYLLNLPQVKVPEPKSADDDYLGGVQQLLKGRKVTVNKASLCLCACHYNKPECLDILRSYQYFHSAKSPADGVRRDTFLSLSKSPKKRLALPNTRAPIIHLSPETEFKLSSKLHFEPCNREISLLELSAYTGNEDCFCYLLQSTDSKHTEEDITAVWSIIVACMRRGCLSEACLLLAVTWVLERVSKADISVLDDANDSVHLDDFDIDDAVEENKKESVLSLACSLKEVIVPTPDMMRFPNRYRNRKGVGNGVVGGSSVLCTESSVTALNDEKEKEKEKLGSSTHPFQETVLHLTCRRGLLSIVRVLLQYGANPHVRDSTVRFFVFTFFRSLIIEAAPL